MSKGIGDRLISETPVAIIDFETTGLSAGHDRVVEVSVVRVDPGQSPRLAFDSLVNPRRPMAATEIHGITDADVATAPTFADIAGEVVEATSGCVVAAYNVYFDVQFLEFELGNSGVEQVPPHFCLMYLRPMLGLGSRCRLEEACRNHGVERTPSHFAAADAMASAELFVQYLKEIESQGISTYSDLARLKRYKFVDSFRLAPLPDASTFGLRRCEVAVSRAGNAAISRPAPSPAAAYWDLLKSVLVDLEVSDAELAAIRAERDAGGLTVDEVRMLHARAFVSVISQFAADRRIDEAEQRRLRRLHDCLAKLGWAPGQ
jgi:DNA polymerase III epsilon subunit family exonuclease